MWKMAEQQDRRNLGPKIVVHRFSPGCTDLDYYVRENLTSILYKPLLFSLHKSQILTNTETTTICKQRFCPFNILPMQQIFIGNLLCAKHSIDSRYTTENKIQFLNSKSSHSDGLFKTLD